VEDKYRRAKKRAAGFTGHNPVRHRPTTATITTLIVFK
jgi:hypothetical protein